MVSCSGVAPPSLPTSCAERASSKRKWKQASGSWSPPDCSPPTASTILRALIDPKRRAGHGSGRSARPRHSTGRWSLLYVDQAADRNGALEAMCKVLLRRYGVVFREVLARESVLPPWREIAGHAAPARRSRRGPRRTIRQRFSGRAICAARRRRSRCGPCGRILLSGERVTVSAADPLNMAGILVPGERVAANSGRQVTFSDGVADPRAIRR